MAERDTSRDFICDVCNGPLRPGDWPHCKGNPTDHAPGKYGHEPFREYVDEHILPHEDPRAHTVGLNLAGEAVEGVRITSRDQRKAIMREQGLEPKGRRYGGHVPTEF